MLALLLIALTSCYAIYVITRSDFPLVEWFRIKVFEKWDEGSVPAYLATCPWCVGFYVTGLVTFLTNLFIDLPVPVLYWLSSAAIVGLFADVHDTMVAFVMKSKTGN